MKKFETIDISGDAGLRVFGKDLKELFANAAVGMYGLISDLNSVNEENVAEIAAEGISLDGFLVSWLNELIFRFDAYGFIGRRIEFSEFLSDSADGSCRLRASVYGEDFDPVRHAGRLLIKAATYHKLRVEKTGDSWVAEVIFDI